MADESIDIVVKQSGFEEAFANLRLLGVTGSQAADKLVSGWVRASQGSAALEANTKLMSAAMSNGRINIAAFSDALDRMSEQELVAAANSQKVISGINNVGQAAKKGGDSVDAHTQSVKSLSGSYTGLTNVLKVAATYLGLKELVDASDAATKIDNQLKQVTKTTDDYNTVYQSLLKTSNQSQTAFQDNVKLFFNMSNATASLGISSDKLATATDTVAESMRQSGTSGAQASRAILELSESLSKGELNGRQFLSIAMNAPGLLSALATGLGTTRQGLSAMAKGAEDAGRSVGGSFDGQVAKAKLTTTQLSQEVKRHTDLLNQEIASGKLSGQALINAQQDLTNLTQKAAIQRQQTLQLEDKQLQESMANNVTVTNLDAKTIVDALIKANASVNENAAKIQVSIGGAVTEISNAWIDYVGRTQQATGANKLIVAGLEDIAKNLNTIIPIVALFAAGWLAVQAISIIGGIATGLVTLVTFMSSTLIPVLAEVGVAFTTAMGPWGLIIAGIVAAIAILITHFQQLKTAINDAAIALTGSGLSNLGSTNTGGNINYDEQNPVINPNGGFDTGLTQFRSGGSFSIPGAGGVDSKLVQFMASPGETVHIRTPAQQAAMPHFRDGGDNLVTTLGLQGVSVAYVPSVNDSVTGYKPIDPTSAAAQTATPVIVGSDTFGAPANDNSAAQSAYDTDFFLLKRWIAGSQQTSNPFNNATIANGTYQLQQKVDADLKKGAMPWTAAQANRVAYNLGVTPDEFYLPGGIVGLSGQAYQNVWNATQPDFTARDGLDYTVPGAGAADSRVLSLAVSPGEHVSVKTPAQQANNSGGGRSISNTIVYNVQGSIDDLKRSQRQKDQKTATTFAILARRSVGK